VAQAGAVSSAHPDVVLVSSAHELAGAEVYLLALLDALGGRLRLELLASDRAPEELYRRARDAGVKVTPVRGLARRPSAAAVLRLARALRRRRPALVHVNLSDQGDGLVAIAAARLARVPASATLHIVLPDRRPALERLSRFALLRPREIIGVSEAVGGYLTRQGAKVCVIPNGVVPPGPLPQARDELGVDRDDFVVGGIGRLDVQKGWDVLCAAAARVHARVPATRFVVIGEGPERARLQARADGSSVRFIGYRERAADFVSGMDVLAVPSRYEGFGLVAVEAMLASVPVVASSVGGLPEVLGDAGVLVPPDDPEALADALISLAERPDLRADLGLRGAERARSRFGHERMSEATLAVWRRAARPLELPTAPVASDP
jgi:glycosyltransferase involved in cell wall biosynthesis